MTVSLAASGSITFRELGHEVSWVGDCPWTGGICLGTETGEILFCRDEGGSWLVVIEVSAAVDAINGVAFSRDYMGVTTRSGVKLFQFHRASGSLVPHDGRHDGAHDIVSSNRGYFFAPMGGHGFLRIDPAGATDRRFALETPAHGSLDFYKMISLKTEGPSDEIACAARTTGLLLLRSDVVRPTEIVGWSSPGKDFVDLCSLPSTVGPRAVVGLTTDRTLVLVRDLRDDQERPQTITLDALGGIAYSIVGTENHLFVLTSRHLIDLSDLLTWCVGGSLDHQPCGYRFTEIEASDIYVLKERVLAAILDDRLRLFELPGLALVGASRISPLSEKWKESDYSPRVQCPTLRRIAC